MKRLYYILVLIGLPFLSVAQKTTKVDNTVYNAVEVQPQFPGGEAVMAKFLFDHLRFESNKDGYVEGDNGEFVADFYVSFIVEKDGSLSNFVGIRGGKKACAEIIRALKTMPKWSPGMQQKKAVRTQFTLPIHF